MTKKICVHCGKVFYEDETGKPGRKKQYCSAECHREVKIQRNREYGIRFREKQKREKASKMEQTTSDSLIEFDRQARAAGLSYGKYSEMLMIQEMQRKRCEDGQQKNVHKENNRQRSVS